MHHPLTKGTLVRRPASDHVIMDMKKHFVKKKKKNCEVIISR